jgi:diguanylate cyclase (GGDEF)-like protein
VFEHYILIGIAIIIAIGVPSFFIFRSSRGMGKSGGNDNGQDKAYLKEILYRDRQLQKLNVEINKLVELNSHYLSFILKVPTIVQRLNSTSKLQTIMLTITEMVNDVTLTDKVEIYLFDSSNNLLKRQSINGSTQQEEVSYAIGEGLIGAAAKHRFVMVREHFNKLYSQQNTDNNSLSQIWMAVPIIFKDRLLGVIGIGEIDNPAGNESDLLRMIADIAGVALINQTMLNEAQHKANTDPLTGLNNRNYFFKMAQYCIETSVRDGAATSIFLFDIDNFKHYNDSNGHTAGDKLLIELGQLLREATRKDSTIVRYGGEEFIVMLPGITKEDAFIFAERFREKISQHPFQYREKQPIGFVSISGGVASFPEDGDTIYKVIEAADMALYQAKSAGKNRVLLHKPYLCQR